MPSPRALAPLLVLLTLTACSGSEPTADAGTEDSGVVRDAGPDTDAGDTDAGADAGPGAALAITTEALEDAYAGLPYLATLAATGGVAPYTWSLIEGTLPAGLTLSSAGVISGTPAELNHALLTLSVVDAEAKTASRQLTLSVRDPGAPVFTVGQFNITYFGSDTLGPSRSSSDGGTSDDLQLAWARDVMRDAGANLWGMVEMVDPNDFELLRSQLPGFSGFLSNSPTFVPGGSAHYGGSSQKLGVLYDSALTFQSAQLILADQKDDFGGRPPLRVDFTTEIQGVETPLVVIVVHMRAESSDPTGPREARQRASAALEAYLDQNLPTQHVLVLGDWNDDVDESISLDPVSGAPLATPYQNFVSAPERYTFITRPLSLAGEDTSIGFENVVDHTLATNELAARYLAGSARVIYADTWVPDFLNTVSDHRPVTSAYALSAETGPFLRLKSPQGGTYQSGSVLAVTWTSFGVSDVRVEASTNDGASWSVLAASVPAVQGSYLWTLPDLASTTVRVRVVDAANPGRVDTSDAPLTLVQGPGRVFINEVLADEQPNSAAYEFVELVNASPFPVSLSGWAVWDGNGSRHVFAAGTTLAAGKAFVVFGGAAAIPAGRSNVAAASSGTLGLNNAGDTVRLLQADGGVVDQVSFGASADSVSLNRSPDATPDAGLALHDTLPSGFSSSPGQRADRTEF